MNVIKGDTVLIIAGKDRGKTGSVQKILPRTNRIIVRGINKIKKHVRPSRRNPHGGIIDSNASINVSNAAVICPNCSKTTRVSYKITARGRVRVCQHCHNSLILTKELPK